MGDIRTIFDNISNDVLLDYMQISMLVGRSLPTLKRWKRDGQMPAPVMFGGMPRFRAGDIRTWLRGDRTIAETSAA